MTVRGGVGSGAAVRPKSRCGGGAADPPRRTDRLIGRPTVVVFVAHAVGRASSRILRVFAPVSRVGDTDTLHEVLNVIRFDLA